MSRESGRIRSMEEVAAIGSSLIGGLLVPQLELERFTIAIGLTALAVAIGLLIGLGLREPETDQGEANQSPWILLSDGFRIFHRDPKLNRLLLLSIFASPLLISFLDLLQPYLIAAAVPPVWLGTVRAIRSIFGILASRYAWWIEQKIGTKHGLPILILAVPLCYAIMPLVTHPVMAIAIVSIGYGLARVQQPLYSQYYNERIESRNRATVLSLISMIQSVWEGGAGLAIGRAADSGLDRAYWLMAGLILVGSLTLLTRPRNVDDA